VLPMSPAVSHFLSKWKHSSDDAPPATSTQGGWHYRSVKMSSSSPDFQPQSLSAAVGTAASTPSWLKVENSPVHMSSASPSQSIQSSPATNLGARSSRRPSLDAAPAHPPLLSATIAEMVADAAADSVVIAESGAAAQRRARQATFLQKQVLVRALPL
jgi:hypothetical protein